MFFWRKKKEKEIVEESKTEKLILTASEQDELDNYIDGIKNDTDFDKILKDTEPKVVKKVEPKIEAEILPKLKKVEPKIEQSIEDDLELDLELLDTLPFLLPMDNFLYETYPNNWNWKNRQITEKEQFAKFDEEFKTNISKYVTEVKTSDSILINKLFYYITICKLHNIQITQNGKIYNLCYSDGGMIISEISTVIEFKFLKNSKTIEILKSLREFGDIEKVEIVLCTTDNRADSTAQIEIDLKDISIIDLKNDDIIFSIDCKNRLKKELRTYKTERKQYNTYIDYMSDMLNTTISKMENCEIRSIQLNATDKSKLNNIRFYPDLEYQNLKISFDYAKDKSLKIDIKFYDAGIKTEINQYVSALHFLELFKEEFENLQSIEIHPTNGEPIYIGKDNIKIENLDNNKCELILNLDLLDNTEYVLKSGEFYFYRFDWVENFGISKMKQITKTGKDLNLARRYTKERFDKIFNNGLSDGWELVKYEDAKKSEENFKKIETQLAKPIVTEKPIIKKSSLLQTVAVDNIVEIVFVTNSGENYKVPICKIYVNYEIDAASKELNLTFWTKNDYKSYGNYISAKLTNSFDIKLVCKSGKIYTILGNRISKFKLKTLTDFLTIKDFEI